MNPLRQSHTAQVSGSFASHTATLPAGATAGNLLIAALGIDKDSGTQSAIPSGWTSLADYRTTSLSTRLIYKIAAGGETTVTSSWTTAVLHSVMWMGEFAGTWGTPQVLSTLNSGETAVGTLDFPQVTIPSAGSVFGFFFLDSFLNQPAPTWVDGMTTLVSTINAPDTSVSPGPPEVSVTTRDYTATGTLDTSATMAGGSTDQAYGALIFFPQTAAAPGAGVKWMGAGPAVADSGTVVVKTTAASSNVKLRVSPNADLSGGTDTAAQATTAPEFTTRFLPSGLNPATTYYYGAVVDGVLQSARGKFRTAPNGAGSFTFAAASCANTGSTSTVFSRIASRAALSLFLMLGDMNYADIATNDPVLFRTAYDQSLGVPAQQLLYAQVPTLHKHSDHDFGGNASNASSPSAPAALSVYRSHSLYRSLPHASAIYETHVVGRVQIVATDHRTFASPYTDADSASKTKLGSVQKQWFKDTLLAAKAAGRAVVWMNAEPWIVTPAANDEDHWGAFPTERRELADFIQANGLLDRMIIVCGDMHGLAYDDGTNSNYATTVPVGQKGPPVYQCAALDRTPSTKGGPYSGGTLAGTGQYGLFTVTDTGTTSISIKFEGIKADESVWATHTASLTVPAATTPTPPPVTPPQPATTPHMGARRLMRQP